MKKRLSKKVLLFSVSVIGIIAGYLLFYPYKYGICLSGDETCLFVGLRKSFAEPLFIFSFALFAFSVFGLFIKNEVLERWTRFGVSLSVLCWFFILITPVRSSGLLTPDREEVSVWMSSLFLIISMVMIIIWTVQERRKLKK